MSASPIEINDALLNVRKAYRLLHDYQRAALDTVHYIGTQFGFSYADGWPTYSDNAVKKGGKVTFTNWAWDWLNMMLYDFHFTQRVEEERLLHFCVWLISDTGYFISDKPSPGKELIQTYANAEASETKLGFLLYWKWEPSFDQFKGNKKEMRQFIETGGELPSYLHEGGVRGKCVDFVRASDESSTEVLLKELIEWAAREGFPLKRVAKAF